jgi:hypothetical protein
MLSYTGVGILLLLVEITVGRDIDKSSELPTASVLSGPSLDSDMSAASYSV